MLELISVLLSMGAVGILLLGGMALFTALAIKVVMGIFQRILGIGGRGER